jgi:hypothetical protein
MAKSRGLSRSFASSVSTALVLVVLMITCYTVQCDEGWLPDRLGLSYEFKIHIDAGKEECFYQEIHAHTTLYVAFQVRLA